MSSIKKFVFNALDKGIYLTDSDIAKLYKGEPNWYTVEQYKLEWQKLHNAKEKFAELETNPNTIIYKSGRKYLIRNKMWENMSWYVIPKIYFNYLKEKGITEI